MKYIKFLSLALAATTLVTLTSCEPTDMADDDIQGTWFVSWTKDFTVDILNTDAIKALCNPGTEAEIKIAGLAETKFQGNRSPAPNYTTYLKLYDPAYNNETNSNTLVHTNHYITPGDVAVSSIDHRDIYITGQEGHIRKKNTNDGRLVLESYRSRVRPKFTVFVNLVGEQTRVNSQGVTVSDRDNRLAGITVDCERGSGPAIENVYRMSGNGKDKNGIPEVKPPSFKDLNKAAAAFGSQRDVLDSNSKMLSK